MTVEPAKVQATWQVPGYIIRELKDRFKGFPVPPGNSINPSTLSNTQLLNLGLPPKPDAVRQSLLRQLWNKAFGRTVIINPYQFDEERLIAMSYQMLNRQADEMPIEETRFETSSNWSGAYITANRNMQFMQIWGVWTVPGNLQIPAAPYGGSPNIPYICSNWIGLDGQRLYLDSSLPQIGTATTLQLDGSLSVDAWTQWWARGNKNTVPLPIGIVVNPGDQVLCVLTASDPQTVVFVIVNLSSKTPVVTPVVGTAPPVTLPDKSTVYPEIAGATAEWIVERPRIVGQQTLYNFPNYGQAEFDCCGAVEANGVETVSLLSGVPQELQGGRLIRMFQVLQNPARTAYISMPWKLSDTSICLKYGGF